MPRYTSPDGKHTVETSNATEAVRPNRAQDMGNLLLCAPGGARWCILEDALRFRVLAGHRRLVVRGLLRGLLRRHC